jgi:DNA-binding transcriptional ArsR family regulator
MSSDIGSLREILKRETNREILVLLNDKGALSSNALMTILNVTPSLMDYHLKVLNDCLVKTDDDKYALSEKGKQAYMLLSDLPKNGGISRRWKIVSLASIVSWVLFVLLLWHVHDVSFAIIIPALCVGLFGSIGSYGLLVKPKITGRVIYIAMGSVVIGCALFLLTMIYRNSAFFSRYFFPYPDGSTGDHIILLLSVVVCYVIGGVVGDLIGKKMKYKWPFIFY